MIALRDALIENVLAREQMLKDARSPSFVASSAHAGAVQPGLAGSSLRTADASFGLGGSKINATDIPGGLVAGDIWSKDEVPRAYGNQIRPSKRDWSLD